MHIRLQNMNAFFISIAVFVLSGLIVNTEAELLLTVISPLGESTINDLSVPKNFECNAEATFVCEVKPYTGSVTWQINGHTYAVCVFENCFTYPPFPENYLFTMDLANGVFNLTVNPVTNVTNNNIYKCDDGITARSVKATVNVYPTNESLNMDESAENRITVTTGCVYPNGINDVTFEWYISKSNTTLYPERLTLQKNNSTVNFSCTEMSTCTIEETSHFNNTVVFDVFDEGDEYYIYVSVMHNNSLNRPPAVQSTERRYKVKNKAEDVKICSIYIIIIIILVVHFYSIQTLFSGYFLYKTFPKNGLKTSREEYQIMGVLVSIPLLGLFLPKYKYKYWREVKKASNNSERKRIIGISITTLINPAFGMFVASISFLRWHEVTLAKSWIFILVLFTGCLFVTCTEVVMLIQCKVFCWKEIFYFPLMILYFVTLWIYLTSAVVYLRIKAVEQQNETEYISVCNACKSNARYQCQICRQFMCDTCRQCHTKHNVDTSKSLGRQHGQERKFNCESCSKKAVDGYCMECKQFLCVICIKEKHEGCGEHSLLIHHQYNEEREREFLCDSCKKDGKHLYAAHAYCLTCSKYLCTSCLKPKHENCTLLWIQEHIDKTEQRLCCADIEDHRELPLEGVCLTCDKYICARCLNSSEDHIDHTVSSHLQVHSTTGRRLHMCLDRNDTRELQKIINYCKDCKDYICADCYKDHREHKLFSPPIEAQRDILCKGCEKYDRLPVECYNLYNDEFLCAKCFESGHKSSPWKRTQYKHSETTLFIKGLRNQQSKCQTHSVLGEAFAIHVEVYCLVCQLYMCRGCFYQHRRIAEYWNKSQQGNLFYCNICKKDNHMYPVECCNLKTGEYLCANCYESDNHYNTKNFAAGQSKDVRLETVKLQQTARSCQMNMFPFHEQKNKVLGKVYCLVCKLYFCKNCFKLHRRLKDVWREHGPQDPCEVYSTPYNRDNYIIPLATHPERINSNQISKTNIGLMVWWHIPLAGFIIALFHWSCQFRRDQRQVNPAKKKANN